MSEIIPSPSAHKRIWDQFADQDYRHAYVEGHVGDFLAGQLHSMRVQRGWSQADLAKAAGVTQPQISGWEASCGGVNLASLHKLAEAFDVALSVKFVPFSQFARDAITCASDVVIRPFDGDSPAAIGFSSFRLQPVEQRAAAGRQNGSRYLKQSLQPGSSDAGARMAISQ